MCYQTYIYHFSLPRHLTNKSEEGLEEEKNVEDVEEDVEEEEEVEGEEGEEREEDSSPTRCSTGPDARFFIRTKLRIFFV